MSTSRSGLPKSDPALCPSRDLSVLRTGPCPSQRILWSSVSDPSGCEERERPATPRASGRIDGHGLRTAACPGLAEALLAAVLALAAPDLALAQGFPNVPRTAGEVLSGLNAPEQGRTAIIAYHNGLLFTVPELPSSQPGADFLVRTWDISDPTDPRVLAIHGVSPMPINAHGYFQSGEYLVLGPNWPPEAPWSFQSTATFGQVTRTAFPDLMCAGVRGCLFAPWFVGGTFWSYGDVSGNASLHRNWQQRADWDHLGLTGVIGHPFLLGDTLYFASDQSRTGIAAYDVSAFMDGDPGNDPAAPALLDVLTLGGPGGYWPELWGGGDRLYMVFPYRTGGNGIRVVDVSDPSDLRFVADVPLPGAEAMYAQFQDDFLFTGDHKVDMRTLQSVLDLNGANVVRPDGSGTGIDTSQFALPLGNLLVTGGVGPNEGMAIWAHQSEPDTTGPSVGWHVPRPGRTSYPVEAPISLLIHETLQTETIVNGTTFIVRPVGGQPIAGSLIFAFDDVLTFAPGAPLEPDTTYEVLLPAGGILDAAGNGMIEYSFTFSTGSALAGNQPPVVASFTADVTPALPGQGVQLAATASDPEGGAVEYRFDFGDGSPRTAWSSQGSASVTYAERGHYRVTVQARDALGSIGSASFVLPVLTPLSGPRGASSSPIACEAPARRIYVVNPDNDSAAAIDADSLDVVWEAPVCKDPRSIARAASGSLWIACHDDDRLQVLAPDGAVQQTIQLDYGSAPAGLVTSPDGSAAWVALQGKGRVLRFATATGQQTGSVQLGGTPRALAVSPDGARLLVTRLISPRDHAEVWAVNASTMGLERTIRIHKLGGDANADGTASGRGTPNYLTGAAFSPDGASAWLVATKPNSERGLLVFDDLDQDNTVRATLIQIDPATGAVLRTIDLDNSDSPSSVDFSPNGDYLFVTLQGNNEMVVLDAFALEQGSGLGGFVTRLAVGRAPQGVCSDPDTGRVLVKNFLSRDVTALEAAPLFERGVISLASSARVTVSNEALGPEVLLGKQIFYDASPPRMSAEGYLSCATCHLDGDSDHRVWDFTGRAEGLRNTSTLRGRSGMGQGNVHWTANFDEIQDFENDIRGAFGGSGFLTDAQFAATEDPLGPPKAGLSAELDALAAYVSSLGHESLPRSPHRAADGSMTAAGEAGRSVFLAQGCASCHGGHELTDSASGSVVLHDVGTLRTSSGARLGAPLTGIDTPGLRGVWDTAPYLHDGSAASLEQVFSTAGGTVLPAETGTPGGGAGIVSQWVHLNNDDTVRGRAYVGFSGQGSTLTFQNVDGGSGGAGIVELRFSSGGDTTELRVNGGAPVAAVVPNLGNEPAWRQVNWSTLAVPVVLDAGASNSIQIVLTDPNWPHLALDEILVSTSDDLARAEPHRRVLDLPPGERADLTAFLLQLDGSAVPGFEAPPTPTATPQQGTTPTATPQQGTTPTATPQQGTTPTTTPQQGTTPTATPPPGGAQQVPSSGWPGLWALVLMAPALLASRRRGREPGPAPLPSRRTRTPRRARYRWF
jgi:DNA-binding beta-propeller fold protein YncE